MIYFYGSQKSSIKKVYIVKVGLTLSHLFVSNSPSTSRYTHCSSLHVHLYGVFLSNCEQYMNNVPYPPISYKTVIQTNILICTHTVFWTYPFHLIYVTKECLISYIENVHSASKLCYLLRMDEHLDYFQFLAITNYVVMNKHNLFHVWMHI